eukprot:TRINITY_DN1620_c0_g1_i17.p4 TRINITY_DN1620_c0_g1~~TRINITY_DN1620_c0_g1_i17.p4  ORF type:complete len:141 (-),score=53.63 TRINITY_DN1620_c0_g1_i17:111-533(-)
MSKLLREHIEAFRSIEKDLGYTIEEGLKKVRTSRDFDTYFTSYVCKYHTAFNYYRKASSVLRIDDIRTPILFISAMDDPVIKSSIIPFKECLVNDYVMVATHPCGGHVGFFTGLNPKQWFAEPALGYFEALEKYYKERKK